MKCKKGIKKINNKKTKKNIMEKISIFKAISNVENNISTIYTKQDLINLLNSIDADKTVEHSDAQFWKKQFQNLEIELLTSNQKIYDLESELQDKTLDDKNLALYHEQLDKSYILENRLNKLKQSMWHYFVNPNEDVYFNHQNFDDGLFADNIRIANIQSRDEFTANRIHETYKNLYDNFRGRVNGFELDDILMSQTFELNQNNQVYISDYDINTNEICNQLDIAFELSN